MGDIFQSALSKPEIRSCRTKLILCEMGGVPLYLIVCSATQFLKKKYFDFCSFKHFVLCIKNIQGLKIVKLPSMSSRNSRTACLFVCLSVCLSTSPYVFLSLCLVFCLCLSVCSSLCFVLFYSLFKFCMLFRVPYCVLEAIFMGIPITYFHSLGHF